MSDSFFTVETPEARILVVDDELPILEFVSYNLKSQGYECMTAQDGNHALELIEQHDFDLIILDIMLPGIDGFSLCKRIRQKSNVALMFLSAKDTEADKVIGLELGADDYLAKPFGVRELNARVKSLLRRQSVQFNQLDSDLIEHQGLAISKAQHSLRYHGEEIKLTPREFELLLTLMQNINKVLTREELLSTSWGWSYIVDTKTVDTHIKRLRDKLSSAGVNPQIIETVRGYGYRICDTK